MKYKGKNPPCYNHAPLKDTLVVQDGWENVEVSIAGTIDMIEITVPHFKEIPRNTSSDCKQHDPNTGAAISYGWDCKGCTWLPPNL